MNPKLLGERAESAFLTAALDHGFSVSKPWGDSLAYDFILDTSPLSRPGRLLRVQVRSASKLSGRKFFVSACRGHDGPPLTPRDIDLLAAYVVPYGAWYLIPVRAFSPMRRLYLFTHIPHSRGRWEKYRGAWDLLSNMKCHPERGRGESSRVRVEGPLP